MDFREYGEIVEAAAKRALTGRVAASPIEREGTPRTVYLAGVGNLAAAKNDLEDLERLLSRTKPPHELKKFHQGFTKSVRAVILGHGFLQRQSFGQARRFYAESLTQLFGASDAVANLGDRGREIVAEMRLSTTARMYLFPGWGLEIEDA